MTKAVRGTRLGGRRAVADCQSPPELLAELIQARLDGSLGELLMSRNFGLQAAVEASKALREVRKVDEDKLVQERIERGGRSAPKQGVEGALKNNLVDRNMDEVLNPKPVPGVYETMGLFEDDGQADDGA